MLKNRFILAFMASVCVLTSPAFAEETAAPQYDKTLNIGSGSFSYTQDGNNISAQVVGDARTGNLGGGGFYINGEFSALIPGFKGEADRIADNATISVGDGTNETYVKSVLGGGIYGYAAKGDKTIVIENNAHADVVIGANDYRSGGHSSGYGGNGAKSYQQSGHYFAPKANESSKIFIEVKSGGSVGQIRGGNNTASTKVPYEISAAEQSFNNKFGAGTQEAKDALAEYIAGDPAWALNEDIEIVVNGQVGYAADGVKKYLDKYGEEAIIGAGGSGYSVNGNVSIKIGEGADVLGNVYASAKSSKGNTHAYIGSSNIEISGGVVQGDVYAGGDYGDAPSYVKGDVSMKLSGGAVKQLVDTTGNVVSDGNVYAGGEGDVVGGKTEVVITSAGTYVEGTIQGSGKNGQVTVDRVLTFDSYTGDKSYAVADFKAINVQDTQSVVLRSITTASEGTNVTLADNAALSLSQVVVTESGALTFAEGSTGTINIADGCVFDLQGTQVDFAGLTVNFEGAITVLLDDLSAQTVDVFTGITGQDGVEVTFKDGTGKTFTTSLVASGDTMSATIPEPATATLSLLALMGLAARRRRK